MTTINLGICSAADRVVKVKQIESEILTHLLPKTGTLISENALIPNDINYIRETVLPPFVELYQNWPDGYRILLKALKENRLNITIFNFYHECLHPNNLTTAYGDKVNGKMSAATFNFKPDRAVIGINNYDNFSRAYMHRAIYHEIMHAISNFAVPDKGKSENTLSSLIDKKYDNVLTNLWNNYMERQYKSRNAIAKWIKDNKNKYPRQERERFYNDLYEVYLKNINSKEYQCWAALRTEKGSDERLEELFKHNYPDINNAEELLARALPLYFGTPEEKGRLKEQEPELYEKIESKVVPFCRASFQKKIWNAN